MPPDTHHVGWYRPLCLHLVNACTVGLPCRMDTFWTVLLLAVVGGIIWLNIKLAPDADTKRKTRAAAVAQRERQRSSLVCPHCGTGGQVHVRQIVRKRGISGGKATGALFTGGVSMLATGLSRKEAAQRMSCGNCGTTWDVA